MCFACAASADELVVVNGVEEFTLIGNVIEDVKDQVMLFQTRDGRLWPLKPEQIKEHRVDEKVVEPFSRKALGRDLRDQLENDFRDDFKMHEADEFVIVYNTHKDYARWVGGLYRRFDRGFGNFWKSRKLKPTKPEFPLSVIVFKSRLQFHQYMERELGTINEEMIAYYNIETNRVTMFDLTADQLQGEAAGARRIHEVLNNPRALPMVATIIHEGTHQLMFNTGLQTRFSDTPLWLNEGIAMYFEVPDLGANNGWRKIGQVNFLRLHRVLDYFNRRPGDSLKTMIMNDQCFRDDAALDMYAQAWAFNYFLLNNYEKEFVAYLKFMSEKPRMRLDTPEERLANFQKFFKVDIEQLDKELIKYIRSQS